MIDESESEGQDFFTEGNIDTLKERQEIERQFNDEEKIICTICRRVFKTTIELRRHFRSHGLAFLKTSNTPT